MAYQKFRADQLFDGYRMRDDQSVLITNGDGTVKEIIGLADAGDDVQYSPGIVCPGFVNCHCHLELSHMKDIIPRETGLVQFVTQVMKDRHYPEHKILEAIDEAESEMLRNGIVAVGDICNNDLTLAQKSKARLWYHNFIEVAGFDPKIADLRFDKSKELVEAFASNQRASMVPHAPYSVSFELLSKIIHLPGNGLLTMHNQETPAENELFLEKTGDFLDFYEQFKIETEFFNSTGKSSLQSVIDRFLPGQQVILVHNVFTSEEDILFVKNKDHITPFWCLCPGANLYISGKLPNIELFINNDCMIVLGTDSLASNDELSILSEMKTILQHFPFTKMENLFQWATLNGARALQMDELLGSFEPGKKPGVVLCAEDLERVQRLI